MAESRSEATVPSAVDVVSDIMASYLSDAAYKADTMHMLVTQSSQDQHLILQMTTFQQLLPHIVIASRDTLTGYKILASES